MYKRTYSKIRVITNLLIEHLDTCMQSIASMNYFVNVLSGKNKDIKG
jgi:hypothetical protein